MAITVHAQGILFDMDGTLVDSNALVDVMWNEFSAALNLDAREVRAFAHGRPSRATVAHYVEDPVLVDEWEERIHAWEGDRFDGVVEIPGAADVVKALPAERWAVVTSALSEPAARRLADVGIPVPAILIGADQVTDGKPHPEGYASAAARLGFAPADCVVFEDTDAGVRAGLAAGCQVVVIGGAQAESMVGLPRVADMTEVTVAVSDDGIELTLGD